MSGQTELFIKDFCSTKMIRQSATDLLTVLVIPLIFVAGVIPPGIGLGIGGSAFLADHYVTPKGGRIRRKYRNLVANANYAGGGVGILSYMIARRRSSAIGIYASYALSSSMLTSNLVIHGTKFAPKS